MFPPDTRWDARYPLRDRKSTVEDIGDPDYLEPLQTFPEEPFLCRMAKTIQGYNMPLENMAEEC